MDHAPNIVLIHCHDLGRFLPFYGRTDESTPNLEALARESIVFDNAFATAPLCTPARGSLFTGLPPHVHGLMGLTHDGWRYRRGVTTLPELLAEAGYRTALIGLQHEHLDPTVLGFDEVHGMGFLPRAGVVAQEAAAWLRESRDDRSPFFLTIGTWEVHRPWPREDYDHVDPSTVTVPPFLPDNDHTRQDLAGFSGAIQQLDRAVGDIVRAVEASCDMDRTAIVFTTDHGAAFPRAKGTLYDPGVEVALMVRPPGSWATTPTRCRRLVSHLDIAPTFLRMADAPVPEHLEGRSLLDDLDVAPEDDDRELFCEKTYHDGYDPIRAVRTSRYKYIRNFRPGPALALAKDLEESPTRSGMGDDHLAPRPEVELYDLVDDPWEQVNLASSPDARGVAADLDGRLTAWMKETLDPLLNADVAPPPARSRTTDAQPDLDFG